MQNENSFCMFFNWTILYAFIASSIATVQAIVIHIALFPLSMAYYQLQTFKLLVIMLSVDVVKSHQFHLMEQ